MTANKGNKAKVMDRWGGYEKGQFYHQTPRKAFKGKAQFKFDDLYITPFTHELTSDGLGRKGYTPLERNLNPTGTHVFDEYLRTLCAGRGNVGKFCERYNAKTADLDGLVFLLVGMSNADFRNRWMVRCADELLRYTDMTITEVARRSGAGTRANLYFIYEREMNCSPTQRRDELRQVGDLGLYKIIDCPAE